MSGRAVVRWTPAAKAQVCALYAEGRMSCTEIAALIRVEHGLQVSKSAVIGVAFRAGLSDRATQEARARVSRPKEARAATRRPRPVSKSAPAPKPKPAPVSAAIPVSLRIAVWEIRDGMCRFIAGDPKGGAATYCGHGIQHGSAWCPGHRKLCTVPSRRPVHVWLLEHRRAA